MVCPILGSVVEARRGECRPEPVSGVGGLWMPGCAFWVESCRWKVSKLAGWQVGRLQIVS